QKNTAMIDAVEIDADAAAQAKENVSAYRWRERIHVVQGDVLHWNPAKKYDCIIANPPFYEDDLKSAKQTKNMAHHGDGLRLEELLKLIKEYLSEDGVFFLLLPAKRMNDLRTLLKGSSLDLHKIARVKQTTHHLPFRLMVQGGAKRNEPVIEEEITIKDNFHQYTRQFVSLLKDYYLHL
ncbi:MAG TPA: methyltransferase, partial [Flavisolibacter sp.]|nr:methyltransferase [Flavisolibacter sp.]